MYFGVHFGDQTHQRVFVSCTGRRRSQLQELKGTCAFKSPKCSKEFVPTINSVHTRCIGIGYMNGNASALSSAPPSKILPAFFVFMDLTLQGLPKNR